MKRHFITVAILAVALALYGLGLFGMADHGNIKYQR